IFGEKLCPGRAVAPVPGSFQPPDNVSQLLLIILDRHRFPPVRTWQPTCAKIRITTIQPSPTAMGNVNRQKTLCSNDRMRGPSGSGGFGQLTQARIYTQNPGPGGSMSVMAIFRQSAVVPVSLWN